MAGSEVLTSTEAAVLLGISATCLRDLIAAGELGRVETALTATGRPSRHRSYVVTRAEVDAYVERARIRRGDLRHLWPSATKGGFYRPSAHALKGESAKLRSRARGDHRRRRGARPWRMSLPRRTVEQQEERGRRVGIAEVVADGRDELTADETRQFVDEEARKYLHMSAEEFCRRAETGDLPGDNPMVIHIALLAGVDVRSC